MNTRIAILLGALLLLGCSAALGCKDNDQTGTALTPGDASAGTDLDESTDAASTDSPDLPTPDEVVDPPADEGAAPDEDVVYDDGESFACLEQKCDLKACLDTAECAAAADCVGECSTTACAQGCVAEAAPPFKGLIQSLVDCGALQSCFADGSGLPGCGDDQCGEGETKINCPEDCSPWGDADKVYACVLASCQVGNCVNFGGCDAGLKCVAGCEEPACTNDCVEGSPGQVQGFLEGIVECAITQLCLPPGAGAQCGNGQCEAGEDSINCSKDCGEPPPGYACLLETCPVGNCPGFQTCNEALLCMAECETSDCTVGCIEAGPSAGLDLLIAVGACGPKNGCMGKNAAPPAADCGNGKCDLGEDVFSCFADCQPPASDCGNGVCDAGESIAGCPADCDASGFSCVNACGDFAENEKCHCSDACKEFGNCCSDYVALCDGGADCGNASCDEPETALNCPQDCNADAWSCLLGQCQAGGCAGANFCSQALACIAACPNSECGAGCLAGQPEQNIPFLNDYMACATEQGCYSTSEQEPDTDPAQ